VEQPRILVIGGANMDLVATVPRTPKPGESMFGTTFKTVPGGKGGNQAVAAARLGARTWFAGSVGGDAFGGELRRTLGDAGVNTQYLKTDAVQPTGTAVILVAETGQNSIIVIPSANMGFTPEDVDGLRALYDEIDVLLIQLELPLETVEAALRLAREKGVMSILDAGPAMRLPAAILENADVVSPNETEMEALTGMPASEPEQALAAADRLRALGARECVVKMGGNGALYAAGASLHVPAYPVTPVDTTAAGDAFTAALGFAWRMMARADAIRFANAAGALATLTPGAQPSMPSLAAVRAFLREKGEDFVEPYV